MRRSLVAYIILNGLIVFCVAMFHSFSPPADRQSRLDYRALTCLVLIESAVLFTPAFLTLLAAPIRFRRVAMGVSLVMTLAVSFLYFLDLIAFVSVREHVVSRVTLRLVNAVLPFLFLPLYAESWIKAGMALFAWCCLQVILWKTAGYVTGRFQGKPIPFHREHAIAMLAVAAILILAMIPALRNWDRTLEEMQFAADRHPITATGVFPANRSPQLHADSIEAISGRMWMRCHRGNLENRVASYQRLIAEPIGDSRRPDVMIVVCECLRSDVINAKTTPNLHRHAQQGLWMRNHHSGGNSSCYGFFSLMFGLDSQLYEQATRLPVGLSEGFHQAGYHTGFFALEGFNTFGMETFCAPNRFDVCEIVSNDDLKISDQVTCDLTNEFFQRRGKYSENSESPRLALVYLFSPHNLIHEREDEIHTPGDSIAMGNAKHRHESFFLRFLNSVHFADRTLAPYLDPERLTFIVGDHGESFGEDRRWMHGTALSETQLKVACLGFGPGLPTRQIVANTSHVDVMPTIADALQIEFRDPEQPERRPFDGYSLLESLPDDRVLSCRALASNSSLFVVARRPNPANDLGAKVFGIHGFIHWGNQTLAPGLPVDAHGDVVTSAVGVGKRGGGGWRRDGSMERWMADRYGLVFDEIPRDPFQFVRGLLENVDPGERLRGIELIEAEGKWTEPFDRELRRCAEDADRDVREAARRVLSNLGE